MSDNPIHEAIDAVEAAGAALRARDRGSIVDAVAEAWERIADPERALGRSARERIPESGGLSLPMVGWALSTTLGDVRAELTRMAEALPADPDVRASPAPLGLILLAGNVFTACVQPISAASSAVPMIPRRSTHLGVREVGPSFATDD